MQEFAKVDVHYWSHPKVRKAGGLAAGINLIAISYSRDHLTDGFIAEHMFGVIADISEYSTREHVVSRLLESGLWEAVEGGWRIHDWCDWQQSREAVEERRQEISAMRAEAGRKGGLAKAANQRASKASKPLATSQEFDKQTSGNLLASKPSKVWQEEEREGEEERELPPLTPPVVALPDEPFSFAGEGEVRVGSELVGDDWAEQSMAELRNQFPTDRKGKISLARAHFRALIRGPDELAEARRGLVRYKQSVAWQEGRMFGFVRWLEEGLWRDDATLARASANGRHSRAYAPGKFVHDG